jgi:hypothetical protein
MFKNENRLIPAFITLVSLMWAVPSAAPGQVDQADSNVASVNFNTASVRGDYAIVGIFAANVAQELGTMKVDGLGNFEGSSIVNAPGANGERIVVNVTFTGTYTVNSDGTGVDSFTATLPDESTVTRTEDFVITKAQVIGGVPIATEIVAAVREPSAVVPGGVFLTHIYTRRTTVARSSNR